MIFVFGSNLAGIHGAGAAKYAFENEGARWKCGQGLVGNSYAIPTKDYNIRTLPLSEISKYAAQFLAYAFLHPELQFKVTRIGCGLAGYTDREIAPMFESAPDNCLFDPKWAEYLPKHKFWSY